MKRMVFSPKGFTLIEMLVVLIISTLLIVISAIGLSVFFRKYQELNAFIELEKDTAEFLNYLENGYYVGSGSNIQFNGVASARELILEGSSFGQEASGIRIIPPLSDKHPNDFIRYYLQGGVIRFDYQHMGVGATSIGYLFPKRNQMDKIKVLSFKVSDANANNAIFVYERNEKICVINVEIEARIEVTEDNYRTVNFKTTMAMKNMERPI